MKNATGTCVVWIIEGNKLVGIVEVPCTFGEALATLDPFCNVWGACAVKVPS